MTYKERYLTKDETDNHAIKFFDGESHDQIFVNKQ